MQQKKTKKKRNRTPQINIKKKSHATNVKKKWQKEKES